MGTRTLKTRNRNNAKSITKSTTKKRRIRPIPIIFFFVEKKAEETHHLFLVTVEHTYAPIKVDMIIKHHKELLINYVLIRLLSTLSTDSIHNFIAEEVIDEE